jgi:hypothetical protein
MFGSSPTRNITIGCSRSNRFVCTSKILLTRLTRYGVSLFTTWPRVNRWSFIKKYCKEAIVLKRANHPNILSIEGVAPKLFEFCMVSQWMPNGNILGYVKKYPGANRLELVKDPDTCEVVLRPRLSRTLMASTNTTPTELACSD